MKKSVWICLLVVCLPLSWVLKGQETAKDTEEQNLPAETGKAVEAESVERLTLLIAGAVGPGDIPRLKQIMERNRGLVRSNQLETIQYCNSLLHIAVEKEVTGGENESVLWVLLSETLAEMYKAATGNAYLSEKVDMYQAWTKEKKKKYLEAYRQYKQGESLRKKYDYEKARVCYEQGLTLYRDMVFNEGEADCLKSLGDVRIALSDYEGAAKGYEEALVIFREIKARLGEANCLQSLGDVRCMLSDNEGAAKGYEKALAIFREIKDRLGEANCLQGLGDVRLMLDDYEGAAKGYEGALVIYREIKDRLGEANCLKSLGDVRIALSDYEGAAKGYEGALAIYREIKNRLGEANCLRSLGDLRRMLSDYEGAAKGYEGALVIYREIKARLGEANCLSSLGDVRLMLSDYEGAAKGYEEALVIYREIKARVGEANCLRSLGEVRRMLDDNEGAAKGYEEALVIYREIKNRLGEANCLRSLGDVRRMLSDNEGAAKGYEGALVIYREIKARLGEANCLQCLGDVRRMLSDYEGAGKRYREAMAIQENIGNRHGLLWTHYRMGQTRENLKQYTAARQSFDKSIRIIEEILKEMKTEDYKSLHLSSNTHPYEAVIDVLFTAGKGPDSFPYAERSRARSFLYLLGNKRFNPKKGVPMALVREEEKLRREMAHYDRDIVENQKKEPQRRRDAGQLKGRLLEIKQKHREVMQKIKLRSPEYASLVSVNPLPLKKIQQLIAQEPDTLLIEYYTTPRATYLWLLDGKNIISHKINLGRWELSSKINTYRHMLSDVTFGPETLRAPAQELYRLLIKPIESHLHPNTRIGIVPHHRLHHLPFGTLMKGGKFLTELGFKFFYLPSASTYTFCKAKNSLKKEQLMAFGNPDGTLPFSRREVETLKALYPLDTEIFTGIDADEDRVKEFAQFPDIIHFACHGGFNQRYPMYSALHLRKEGKEDGRLEVHEIFEMQLKPAYLVTLSACETSLGDIRSGDELTTFSRAFIYAGASGVLASQWPVSDYYTSKWMIAFYRSLKENSKIDALQDARRYIMETLGKGHPFYWAGFVLIGDPR